MQFTFLILLLPELYFSIAKCGALAPDIYLEGKLLSNSDSTVLQLICSTNTAVQLCSVEFLIEERTHDSIRYHDNKCYHSMRICSPSLCKCSDNCSSFTLNVTVTPVMMDRLYSCETRIEKDGVTYIASISVMPDDNGGLILYKKIVIPFGSVTVSQKATSSSPNIITVSAPLNIAGTAFGFVSCVLLVIVLLVNYQRRFCNSKTGKDLPTNNNEQCDKQTGKDLPTNNNEQCDKQTVENSLRQDVFKVHAEIQNGGTRFSIASSTSDNRSVDLLFDNANQNSVVVFHRDQFESSYL